MATRFYLPSTGAPDVNPPYGAWDNTANAVRRKMVLTRINSANSFVSSPLSTSGNILLWQFTSAPIAAQTISGTVKIQARAGEGHNSLNAYDRVRLVVVSNDGGTLRGTLLALAAYKNTEFNVGGDINKTFADGDALTSVVAQANDRIVLELGCNQASYAAIAHIVCGDDSATDLPENETETSTYNPWLEFSMNIAWPSAAAADLQRVLRGVLRGVGRGLR